LFLKIVFISEFEWQIDVFDGSLYDKRVVGEKFQIIVMLGTP
jgi:hypothetical protein